MKKAKKAKKMMRGGGMAGAKKQNMLRKGGKVKAK